MNTPLLYLVRAKVIEGRSKTQDQLGRKVYLKSLGLKAHLLEHPSPPFHYVALGPAASGAWKSQKIIEFITKEGEMLWLGARIPWISRRAPEKLRDEIQKFLEQVSSDEVQRVWLDSSCRVWRDEWLFLYRSFGNFEQFLGQGTLFWRGNQVCTVFCLGGVVQD